MVGASIRRSSRPRHGWTAARLRVPNRPSAVVPIACRRPRARIVRPTRTCTAFAAPPTRCTSLAMDARPCGPFRVPDRTRITARSKRGNILFVSDNPLSAPWAGPYGGVPPWDRMAPEHFPGAFASAIAEQRSEIDAIAANTEAPTFDNAIAAMERSGRMLDRLERMFGVARESVTNPSYQALEREWQPKLAAAADELLFNEGLFKRI